MFASFNSEPTRTRHVQSGPFVEKRMLPGKAWILAALVAIGTSSLPIDASAQRVDVGPGGVGIDMRSRGQRDRDELEAARREREEREMRRERRRG